MKLENATIQNIAVDDLTPGFYLLNVSDGEAVIRKKIIIQ
jgi:hypothetical protein